MSLTEEKEKLEKLKNLLVTSVKRGNWKRVIEKYGEESGAHGIKLTKAGDTALHLAVYYGPDKVVENLVTAICSSENKDALKIKDEKGNTPLHVAAEIGNHRICKIIVSVDAKLVDLRNKKGETPLFLAAIFGNKDAFYCLYHYQHSYRFSFNSRRDNGDTILHSFIKTEQFDLAFELINKTNETASWVDSQGYTALHVLATKPTAFKSGSHMGLWQHILYYYRLKSEYSAPTRTQVGNHMSNTANFFTNLWEFGFLILSSFKRIFKKKEDLKDDLKNEETIESHPPPLDTQLQKHGFDGMRKLRKENQKHRWAVELMDKLVELTPPHDTNTKMEIAQDEHVGYVISLAGTISPILVAARYGVVEMVSKLFKDFPQLIHYCDSDGKNVVLLAAEYRQTEVYKFLLHKKKKIETLFRASDKFGNTALHLAANVGDHNKKTWRVTGPALQLQSEIKWYQFVEDSMQNKSFVQYNNNDDPAEYIFNKTHQDLLKSGQEWLVRTSESCSLLAALITTVAFASATTVPGGNGDNGTPPLERETGFFIFALSSLIALCLSTTSVVAFLSILSSKFEMQDFVWKLPVRLLIGLSSLFFSIVAMLVSFCAGHYFMLSHRLQNMVVIVYVAASLPIALFFAIVQIHLYFDLLVGILSKLPS